MLLGGNSAFAWITSVEDVERAVKSGANMEGIVSQLSPEILQKPVLPYDSITGRARPERPRIIGATDDANFYMAIVTDEKLQTSTQMEFAQVDPRTGEPDFYLLDFSEAKPRLQKNPEFCMRCHQLGPRRVLRTESYPWWPGWYGTAYHDAISDRVPGLKTQEYGLIKKLLAARDEIPLLKYFKVDSYAMEFMKEAHSSAQRLTDLATLASGRMLFQSLRKHPDFERVKFALAGFLENPSDLKLLKSLLPEDLFADYMQAQPQLMEEISRSRDKTGEYLGGLFRKSTGLKVDANPGHPENSWGSPLTLLEWLLRKNGDTLANYSNSGSRSNLFVHDGAPDGGVWGTVLVRLINEIERSTGVTIGLEFGHAYFSELPPKKILRTQANDKKMREFESWLRRASQTTPPWRLIRPCETEVVP